jgi:ABC-type branched-subunit amino acid transport system substrate-binding protein
MLGLISFALLAATASAGELTAAEARGRQIYLEGTSPTGQPISAYLAASDLELPGESATCGSCHGHDGTGRPESGVDPLNVRWSRLTRPYGHLHESGLEHGAFDETNFGSYMRTGIYPGGRRGDPSMPTYTIADRDLADLTAFLKRLGEATDPGITEATVRLATLVPAEGATREMGRVIVDVLEAYFADVNRRGGIYGRRIELVTRELAPGEGADVTTTWLGDAQPFAVVSPFTPRVGLEVQRAISGAGLPLIGPLTLYSLRSFASNRAAFYLFPDLATQLQALVRFAASELELAEPRVAVLHAEGSASAEVARVLDRAVRAQGWQAVETLTYAPGAPEAVATLKGLQQAGVEVLVPLAEERELMALLTAAQSVEWTPIVLAPGVLAGAALHTAPEAFSERLLLAYPTLPQDRKPRALNEISRLLAGNQRANAHVQAMLSAYASAVVTVEALRRAGRELTRQGLAAELEQFYGFETGVTPPITFTANRRIGAAGAYVLSPGSLQDGRLPEAVRWVDAP